MAPSSSGTINTLLFREKKKLFHEAMHASIYPAVELSDAGSCLVLRSHVWPCKALEPEGRILDCSTTAWSPSIDVELLGLDWSHAVA